MVVSDPTRRHILELVAVRELSAGEIAAHFQTTRPGVSRHLRVLRDAGLLSSRGEGQRRMYRLEGRSLAELENWVSAMRALWDVRLNKLDEHLAGDNR
jgi:DNA-binding transcriptional ArsR family regulator